MHTISYQKEIPVVGSYDVLVCGGGSAGYTAAVAAARLGAKTALLERSNILGGVITTGGNAEIGLFYVGSKQVISGIGWETVSLLAKDQDAKIPEFGADIPHSQQNVSVNPVMFGKVADDLCCKAGVDVYYHHQLVDVLCQSGRVESALFAAKGGLFAWRAKQLIDCTGDGDLAAFAGADFELGDVLTGELQPGTLRFYLTGYRLEDISQPQVEQAFEAALQAGELQRSDFWSLGGSPMEIFFSAGNNINHITHLNGADACSKSEAEVRGRQSVARVVHWARKRVHGAEHCYACACGGEVGVRESRRICCDTRVTVEDYTAGIAYSDSVCYSYYPIDLHRAREDATLQMQPVKQPAQIPLGALLPKQLSNLMVAGRCACGDRLANSAYRVKASCMAMGQAAGTTAALASKAGCTPREVPIALVRESLHHQGALVPGL